MGADTVTGCVLSAQEMGLGFQERQGRLCTSFPSAMPAPGLSESTVVPKRDLLMGNPDRILHGSQYSGASQAPKIHRTISPPAITEDRSLKRLQAWGASQRVV